MLRYNSGFKTIYQIYDEPGTGGDGTINTDGQPAGGQPAGNKVSFTPEQQEQINRIVQERVAREKEQNQKTIEQLEALRENKRLTDEERESLTKRIEELNSTMLTKEELAAKQKKELETRHTTELNKTIEETKRWRNLYETSTIEREITDQAVIEEAYRPSQIVSLLKDRTYLTEELVDDKPTGRLVPRVKLMSQDSNGKPVELNLTVGEAIKEMKKMTDEYGNLFKSGLTGGLGGTKEPGNVGDLNLAELDDHEVYLKNREKVLNA